MNVSCNRDPLTCRCWYHQGHADEPPSGSSMKTSPMTDQADMEARACALLRGHPADGGDGDTFIPRCPTVAELTAAFAQERAAAYARAAEVLEAKATRAREAAIGGGMDPLDAQLLDHEFSLAARDILSLKEGKG